MRPQVQTDGESLTAHTIWSESVLCIISSVTMSMLACSQRINHPLRFLRHGLETIHDNLLGLHLQHLAHYDPSSLRSRHSTTGVRIVQLFLFEEYVRAFLSYRDVAYLCIQDLGSALQWRAPALLLLLRALFDSLLQAGTLRFIMDKSSTSMDVVVVSESHVCCKGSTATLGMRKKMVIENQMRRTGCV